MNNLSLKDLYKTDCNRYWGKNDWKMRVKTHFAQAAYRYTKAYRRVHNDLGNNKKGLRYMLHRARLLRYSYKYGYQINPRADIGPGLYMGHRGTVIINGEVKMGANVNIATGVTIGQENRGSRVGAPEFGSNIWIGTNAVIVGKVQIGDNVLIAPNTYINFDVPANSIVVGNPAKIIEDERATESYVQHPYKE